MGIRSSRRHPVQRIVLLHLLVEEEEHDARSDVFE